MKVSFWAVLPFEAGHHNYVQNAACKMGIPAIFPMVETYNPRMKVKTRRPALGNLIFIPANEDYIEALRSNFRFIEKPWRVSGGDLEIMPDLELQAFLARLDQRERKAKKAPGSFNLADLAGHDGFALWQRLYGLQAAIKRFGSDLRELAD
jgi:hypothetical protein